MVSFRLYGVMLNMLPWFEGPHGSVNIRLLPLRQHLWVLTCCEGFFNEAIKVVEGLVEEDVGHV
jgi:hypothetical protein